VGGFRELIDAHEWVIAGVVAGVLVTLGLFAAGRVDGSGALLTIAVLLVPALFALIGAERDRRRGKREREDAEAAAAHEADLARAHARDVARNVRAVLLETAAYQDTDEYLAKRDARFANPDAPIELTDWSIGAILGRGESTLDDARLDRLAEGFADNVAHIRNVIGPEASLLEIRTQRVLNDALKSADRAASAAEQARAPRRELRDLVQRGEIPRLERERIEDAWRDARGYLFGLLQILEGDVERLESAAGPSLAEQYEAQQATS